MTYSALMDARPGDYCVAASQGKGFSQNIAGLKGKE